MTGKKEMEGWKITWGTQQLNSGSLKTYSSDYKRLKHKMNKIMKPRYSGAGSNDLYKPKLVWFKKKLTASYTTQMLWGHKRLILVFHF